MSFVEGTILCANCREAEDQHCQTCESCTGEPVKECCMEGWPETLKESERRHWANKRAPAEPAAPEHVAEFDDDGEH